MTSVPSTDLLRRLPVLGMAALVALAMWACSSKMGADTPDSSSSGTKKTVKDGGDDKDDDGKGAEGDDTTDPCAGKSEDDELDPDDPCDDFEPPPPNGAFYETVLNPSQKKACHAQGKAFSWETQACLDVSFPAAFTCDRAGVLAAFANSTEVATELTKREGLKYVYDQCAVDANSKPYVILACPTTDDQDCEGTPVCKTQDDLDVGSIKICETKLSLGG